MSSSSHSPLRRAVALRMDLERKTGKPNLTPEERRGVERKLDAILDLLPKSVAEDPRNEDWEAAWYETINQVVGCTASFPAITRPPSTALTPTSPRSPGSSPCGSRSRGISC